VELNGVRHADETKNHGGNREAVPGIREER
jgi:hypothetical protein